MNYTHLGIHSKYEVCSGSRSHEDYIQKAKFLGVQCLGICDYNTLGGTFSFQQACQKANMNFTLGETVSVKGKQTYNVKLYVKNKTGWQNLLRINKAINVDNQGWIDEKELLQRTSGLILVILPDSIQYFSKFVFYQFNKYFKDIYFQFDCSEYKSNERDKEHLLNLNQYLNELYLICPPVIISDSYYLDKQDSHIKQKLGKIGKVPFFYASDDQYFKSIDQLFDSLSRLFKQDDERLYDIFARGIENTNEIAKRCKFEIEVGRVHLPKYKMNQDEAAQYKDTNEMFDSLIAQGLIRIGRQDDQQYLDRIDYEINIIDMGQYRDYFLITYDICKEADRRGITRNLGRGSAASSLCLYLMNVTMIDPIKYDLPFDRFLNEKRVFSGLPDVDLDIQSNGREEIKQYIVQKYGYNHTAYVGTYIFNKIKSGLKELAKQEGYSEKEMNYLTAIFPKRVSEEPTDLTTLCKYSQETPQLKRFIKNNVDIINDIQLINGTIKTTSIHASAVLILPKEDKDGNPMEIWDWMPCRKGENFLVTEFSGSEVDELGFLKEDILGVSELDNVGEIFKQVEQNYGTKLTIDSIPLNDNKTYWMYQEGYTEQVFQCSSSGMRGLIMDMKPENIQHIMASVALYRPGAMGSGSHMKYIKVKNGESIPEIPWGFEDITKDTYGQIIYQEQIIWGSQKNAGFTLVEGDELRYAIGKKKQDKLDAMKPQFIGGMIKNGCPKEEAEHIWELFESFGDYGFNYSHAACYGILSYITMYLKAHYPLEFYTVALQLARDNERPGIIAEIKKLGEIRLAQPDINNSKLEFTSDKDKKIIYWSITSVKQMGGARVDYFLEEREKHGKFFSLKDFFDKVEKRKLNKLAVTNLILAGAFDELYDIRLESDRIRILREYYEVILKEDLPEEYKNYNEIWKNYWWILKAKELTGLGFIDFKPIMKSSSFAGEKLIDLVRFNQEESIGQEVVVGGIIEKIIERKSKRGKFIQIDIDINSELIYYTMWNEEYEKYKKYFKNAEKTIIFIKGTIKYDGWKKCNVLHSNENTKVEII